MKDWQLPRQLRDPIKLQQALKTRPERYWTHRGEKMALELFHEMADRVPAYKDFLSKRKFDPKQVQNIQDFSLIPLVDKDNYLRQYPREDLCWDGKFADGRWVISTTSGSTGEPFYFPRQDLQDEYYALTAELYLRENFHIQDKSTLYIDAFPMGAWIGGLFTYEAVKRVAARGGYKFSVITPGIHRQEVINAVKQLGGSFDQIIIGVYAPFLRDILDDGVREGIVWSDLDIGFVFSAEAFTENFRDHVFKTTQPREPIKATLNQYGTVDLGTMAHETPETILVRRLLVDNGHLRFLFPEARRQATLCQYNPGIFYFESEANNLLCTSNSGLPLVRYDLKDYGGVIPRHEASAMLAMQGVDVDTAIRQAGIEDTAWNLPYVYVYERNDFSVSYYAFTVYPDMIRRITQGEKFHENLTGKFTMFVDYGTDGKQRLNVHIEMKYGIKRSDMLAAQLRQDLHANLLKESSEYREVAKTTGGDISPIVKLWPYKDATYFKSGTKQKWVIK